MRKITKVVEDDWSGFVEIRVRRTRDTGKVEVLSLTSTWTAEEYRATDGKIVVMSETVTEEKMRRAEGHPPQEIRLWSPEWAHLVLDVPEKGHETCEVRETRTEEKKGMRHHG